jgi:EmrB/QacA subfamily drug resistance transporter
MHLKFEKLDPAILRLALVLLTGVLAVVFDTTIVAVALRTLADDFHASVATIQWVTTGYLLALGIAVPLTGWLVGRFGAKQVWMSALALFFAGSLGASLAWNAQSLIAFRVVQGVGGGVMLPVLQTLLIQAAGGRSVGRVTALVTLPAMVGPVLGPVVGGLIVHNLSWRWIFWVNVPFCVAGLLLAWRMLPAGEANRGQRLDLIGFLLLSPGIAAVLLGLSRVGEAGGFGDPLVLASLAVGVVLVTAFTLHARRRDEPLVDVRLFGVGSFTASAALMFLSGFVLYGAMLVLPLYFQEVRGTDAFQAGLMLAPQGLGVLLTRSWAGSATDRYGPRWIVCAGLAVVALGTLPFAAAGAETNVWLLCGALLVRGIGLGAVTVPVMAGAYQGLRTAQIPHASIITRAAQQIGGSFGSAVLAVILTGQLTEHDPVRAFDNTVWWATVATLAAVLFAIGLPGAPRPPAMTPRSA